MYRFARKRQRRKLQTEQSLTYSYLRPLLSEAQHLGPLKRLGETYIQPTGEFLTLSLPDSELILCVLEGRLEVGSADGPLHEIEPGDVCRIPAAAEFELTLRNPSAYKKNRIIEVWFSADLPGGPLEPQAASLKANRGFYHFLPLASGQGHEDGVALANDCAVYLSRLRPSENLIFETVLTRSACIFVLDGGIQLENDRLIGGDSALVFGETRILIAAQQQSAVILIDLPPRDQATEAALPTSHTNASGRRRKG